MKKALEAQAHLLLDRLPNREKKSIRGCVASIKRRTKKSEEEMSEVFVRSVLNHYSNKHGNGYTITEISIILKIPRWKVKIILNRALKKIRYCLEKQGIGGDFLCENY